MFDSNRWKSLWIVISVGSIWGCAQAISSRQISEVNDRILTEADAGKTVEMHVGEIFQISLRGNPTTGYTWHVRDTDETVIRQTGDPVHVADSGLMGAGGKTTFRFQAIRAGEVFLILDYRRSFENKPEPEKQFEIRLIIR
ncbi:MAG: protease inhibitor I42 family protein [Desulfatirhabdiaceae bacterium]